MKNFVINEKGALDLKEIPNEDEFEKFWNSIQPFFSVSLLDTDAVAYAAAKTAWKQAIMMCEQKKKGKEWKK